MRTAMMMLAAGILCLSACKKEEVRTMKVHGITNKDVSKIVPTAVTPENVLNPYDSIGFLHNEMMDYIEVHRPEGTMDRKLSVTLIRQYCKLRGRNVPSAGSFESVRQTVKAAQEDIHGLIIARTGYAQPVKRALGSLVGMLANLSDREDYATVKAAVVDFENEILCGRLSADEQAIVLKTTSLARHSIFYWMGRSSLPVQVTSVAKWKGIVRWFAGAINDIGGFVKSLSVEYATECSDDARETVDYCMPDV